ncbi:nucleotide-binding domain containing protein [Azospirillum halopraeferens]|uniref:nucleotide-binding domain containing protein n=1 Tax=Azospirillum halopraeferens TaxID=34010 RepID=UPI000409C421|nr:nucleotide-binding domain containing protein [Azospirillum halopraeferens]
MAQILVLTDTLAGAVDAALAFVEAGTPAGLMLSARADVPEVPVAVVDLDTARLAPAAAAVLAVDAVRRLYGPERTLVRYMTGPPDPGRTEELTALCEAAARNGDGPARLVVEPDPTPDPTEIAAARRPDPDGAGAVVWVGGRALAGRLAAATGVRVAPPRPAMPTSAGPVLTVAGARGPAVRDLAAADGVRSVAVASQVLRQGPGSAEWGHAEQALREALTGGGDALLCVDGEPEPGDGHAVAVAMGRLVSDHLQRVGGLVLSGGETVRAVLLAASLGSLRVQDAAEPGVAVCLTEGRRVLPVILRADHAEEPGVLVRCLERLRTAV